MTKAKIDMLQDENWLLKEQLDNAERLNYDMRDEIDVKLKVIDKLHEQIKIAKSDAIWEFAERLKNKIWYHPACNHKMLITSDYIYDLARKMTEEQK